MPQKHPLRTEIGPRHRHRRRHHYYHHTRPRGGGRANIPETDLSPKISPPFPFSVLDASLRRVTILGENFGDGDDNTVFFDGGDQLELLPCDVCQSHLENNAFDRGYFSKIEIPLGLAQRAKQLATSEIQPRSHSRIWQSGPVSLLFWHSYMLRGWTDPPRSFPPVPPNATIALSRWGLTTPAAGMPAVISLSPRLGGSC